MGVFTVVSIRKGQTNIEILLGEHNYLKSYGLYRGYKFRGFIFKSEEKPPKRCLLGKKELKTWKHPYGISKITPGYWRSKIWKYNGKSIVLLFEIPIKTLPKKLQYCKYIVLLKKSAFASNFGLREVPKLKMLSPRRLCIFSSSIFQMLLGQWQGVILEIPNGCSRDFSPSNNILLTGKGPGI